MRGACIHVLALALLLAACAKNEDRTGKAPGPALLSEVRQALSERERKLWGYRYEGRTDEGAQSLRYAFAFRAPNRMRGELREPAPRTLSFDGERLFELLPAERRHITYLNRLPSEKRALFLASTFTPFVPEGFRSPLLPSTGVTAKRAQHPKRGHVVDVTVEAKAEGDVVAQVTYTLRPPAMDFLAKRTRTAGRSSEIRVESEHCDAGLKLCVPTKLSHWQDGKERSVVTLSKLELNPALPPESFTLEGPDGYERTQRELVESK